MFPQETADRPIVEGHCHLAQCACGAAVVEVDGYLYCRASCADPEMRAAEVCQCAHPDCKKHGGHVERPLEASTRPTRPEPLVPPPVIL